MSKILTFWFPLLLISLSGCSECSRSGRNAELARAQREQQSISNPSSSEAAQVPMVTVNRPTVIQMSKRNGVYYVPVTMNGLTLDFIFDTGAADILISFAEFATLLRQGKISESDMLGTEIYMDASGNVSESQQFIIRELRLGDRVIYNVKASISESLDAPLLLGQSALERFGTVEIDYEKNQVILSN